MGSFLDDTSDALGREPQLHQGDAAVERLGIAGDQATLETELADALEHHRAPLAFGQARGEAEAEPGIAGRAVADRVDEVPAVVRPVS
jgi:hypothetical protein